MTTVAISIVHFDPERNREVYLPHRSTYIDLPELIAELHDIGLSVRLACIMAGGFIDSAESIAELVAFGRRNGAEQLTVRPVNQPAEGRSEEAARWAAEHHLSGEHRREMGDYFERNGKALMKLIHGATVYDVGGQNVCLTDSLTIEPSGDIRQLIFFLDGHLRYDWQYEGAILL